MFYSNIPQPEHIRPRQNISFPIRVVHIEIKHVCYMFSSLKHLNFLPGKRRTFVCCHNVQGLHGWAFLLLFCFPLPVGPHPIRPNSYSDTGADYQCFQSLVNLVETPCSADMPGLFWIKFSGSIYFNAGICTFLYMKNCPEHCEVVQVF